MATQANALSSRQVRQERAEKPPQGLIAQLIAVVARPKSFFRVLPRGRSWLAVGVLILFVVGFTATRQISSTTSSLIGGTQTAPTQGENGFGSGRNFGRGSGSGQTGGASSEQTAAGTSTTGTGRNFAPPSDAQTSAATVEPNAAGTSTTGTGRNFAPPSDAQASAATGTSTTGQTAPTGGAQTGTGAATTGTTGQQASASTTAAQTPLTTSSTLSNALLAASSILILWLGQAALLSLVPMLRGFKPQFSRGLQIAVWASVPLAIMLILRQLYFAAGGTGGMTGLSLLLTRWSGYSSLPEIVQRVLTTFMSNLSLFWVWGLLLLYFGARATLRGRRWTAIVVIVMWVTLSTVIPALVSQPVTSIAPRVTTSQTTTAPTGTGTTGTRATTATGAQVQFGAGGNFGGGNFGAGRTTGRNGGG